MNQKRVRIAFATVGVVAAIAAFSATALAGSLPPVSSRPTGYDADPHRKVNVTAQQAIESVRTATGKGQGLEGSVAALAAAPNTSTLSAEGPVDGAVYRYYNVTGPQVVATVDAFDGHVASLVLVSDIPSQRASKPIGAEQAKKRGRDFFAVRSVAIPGVEPTVVQRDRGQAITYEVTWQQKVNGANVPESRAVEMDAATGVVFKMIDLSRSYDTPPSPSVDEISAVAKARSLAQSENRGVAPQVVDTELGVTFDPSGQQMLTWSVRLSTVTASGSESYWIVGVDALTGATAIVGRG